jgi:hypothetical protein
MKGRVIRCSCMSWKLFDLKLPEGKSHNLLLINKFPGSPLYVSCSSIPCLLAEESSFSTKTALSRSLACTKMYSSSFSSEVFLVVALFMSWIRVFL